MYSTLRCIVFALLIVPAAGAWADQNDAGDPASHPTAADSPYLTTQPSSPSSQSSVYWRPWGRVAFAQARRLRRPVLLDMGASWSFPASRMQTENYSDPKVAAYLNEHFVCIRVDAEDRPDLCARYLRLAQITSRGQVGSLPLVAFLTSEGHLFFARSYVPRESPDGRGFFAMCQQAAILYQDKYQDIRTQARDFSDWLYSTMKSNLASEGPLTTDSVQAVRGALFGAWVQRYPGFGPPAGPRFPDVAAYEFLLEEGIEHGDAPSLGLVRAAFDAMHKGSILDPIEGGMFRYAVDGLWRQPAFEKLLGINAEFMGLLADMQRVAPDSDYGEAQSEIWSFLRRRMALSEGGFAASLAAAAPGETPTAYYCWTPDQLAAELPADMAALAGYLYDIPGLDGADNPPAANADASSTATQWRRNPYIPRRAMTIEEASRRLRRLSPAECAKMAVELRKRLIEDRSKRAAPPLDCRFFAAPNARLAAALWRCVNGAEVARNTEYANAAQAIAGRIERELARPDGLIRHRAGLPAEPPQAPSQDILFLEDQCAWFGALLAAHEATGDPIPLQQADILADKVLEVFRDPDGFALNDRALLSRAPGAEMAQDSKNPVASASSVDDPTTGPIAYSMILYEDGESPGPVSELALCLARLGSMTANAARLDKARRLLLPPLNTVTRLGRPYTTWARAAALTLEPCAIYIVGDWKSPETQALLRAARQAPRARVPIAVHAPNAIPEALRQRAGRNLDSAAATAPIALFDSPAGCAASRSPEELRSLLARKKK